MLREILIPGLLGFNLMSSGLKGVGFVLVEIRVRTLIKRLAPVWRGRAGPCVLAWSRPPGSSCSVQGPNGGLMIT
jgi:hypothetical protein